MKNYLWVIGGVIGMSIAELIWNHSKMKKKMDEDIKKAEEETEKLVKQIVDKDFPEPKFELNNEFYEKEFEEMKKSLRSI